MIFKIASRRHKKDRKEKEYAIWHERMKKWHQFFAILPRRISSEEVACCQWITRRVNPDQSAGRGMREGIEYQYGPLTNLLQPMEGLNDSVTGVDLGAGDQLTLQTVAIHRDGSIRLSAAAQAAQVDAYRKHYEESGVGGYFHTPKDSG